MPNIWSEDDFKFIETTATGRRALQLPSGTTLELGDTGIRDMSGNFIAGTVASGRLLVRRNGQLVTWIFDQLKVAASQNNLNSRIMDLLAVPGLSAFRPPYTESEAYNSGKTATQGRIAIAANGVYVQFADPTLTYTLMVSYITNDAWPSALPGVADGQPIGV
jgi:hypothetical protein